MATILTGNAVTRDARVILYISSPAPVEFSRPEDGSSSVLSALLTDEDKLWAAGSSGAGD